MELHIVETLRGKHTFGNVEKRLSHLSRISRWLVEIRTRASVRADNACGHEWEHVPPSGSSSQLDPRKSFAARHWHLVSRRLYADEAWATFDAVVPEKPADIVLSFEDTVVDSSGVLQKYEFFLVYLEAGFRVGGSEKHGDVVTRVALGRRDRE